MSKKNIAESVLDWLKSTIMSQHNLAEHYLVSKGNDNGFENLVTEKIIPLFEHDKKDLWPNFEMRMIPVLAKHFPDVELSITDDKGTALYGIELKSRNNGSWVTNGGSIFESTSKEDYEEIYLLFATRNKDERQYTVKWDCYWNVASDIKVTHSPRYIIDMSADNHIFNSSIEYQNFRKEDELEKIKFVQKYFGKKLEEPTWYSNLNNDSTNVIRPTLWGDIERGQRNRIRSEMLVLFPKDLLSLSSTKYINCVEYLMSQYNVFTPNIRDLFSASGKFEVDGMRVPHIFKEYKKYAGTINSILKAPDEKFKKMAMEYWNPENIDTSFVEIFRNIAFETIDNTYPSEAETFKKFLETNIFR